ncbi:DDT domain-containing protein PTM-like isoform X3 [Canna indica]|uniref:DDT domain-containing protein PTM-like isoform X3 n=1 Tax=Canna indica TaxID=4628 RepID=A0AAQ3KQC3_9LILI|nr:DDT domain-containing protein PTM-like isoform X3 [Canna indica]
MGSEDMTSDNMVIMVERTDQQPKALDSLDAGALVGSYVSKETPGAKRPLVGKVASYDPGSGLYLVVYENGNQENLDYRQASRIAIAEDDMAGSNMKLSCRKRKLDLLVSSSSGDPKVSPPRTKSRKYMSDASDGAETSSLGRLDSDLSEDADSSSTSCDYVHAPSVECPSIELPPSSSDIAVPDESISYLFSVYSFLRSFSVQLFLSPFGLDELVWSLNCMVQNSLLDAIHLQLMRALRRHLQVLSSEGFELASRCLRHYDWSLLDALTWPAFVVEYLYIMGYMGILGGKGYGALLSDGEYYGLPVNAKLRVLQILCDDVINSGEIRTELETRDNIEDDVEGDTDLGLPLDNGPRNAKSRSSENPDSKSMYSLQHSKELPKQIPMSKAAESCADGSSAGTDGNSDECLLCGMDGTLICCDGCPSAYHSRCIGLNKASLPDGQWFCPECRVDNLDPTSSRVGKGIKGAEHFGIDACGRLFLGTCNYLLVVGTLFNEGPFSRYYNQNDVNKVLSLLSSVAEYSSSYALICNEISKYWEIPATILEAQQTQTESASLENLSSVNSEQFSSKLISDTVQKNFPNTRIIPNGNESIITTMPPAVQRFTAPKFSTCVPKTENIICGGGAGSSHVPNKNAILMSDGSRYGSQVRNGRTNRGSRSFNRQSYMNQYIQGDIAALAAANLAILTSGEKSISEANVSSHSRKNVSISVALQMKAFSEATLHFLWPTFEKKLLDIPRERCGWCIACKGSITNKKGCFLNLAAANTIKGSVRNTNSLRPTKHYENYYPVIAAYLANMEETLRGLIVGSLLDTQYNLQWRKQVREASSCRILKKLLLELEKNIRGIAFSGAWFKLLNDGPPKFSTTLIGASRSVPSQKRGPGRRSKKQITSESASELSDDIWKDVQWWRGGKLSKVVLQIETLPSFLVRKAARQGGYRRIPNIVYPESIELPRRSRQFAWRAAVEMCKNASQLALQVRCLDAHIRWKDLIPPEQTFFDGKASDEVSVFRNVVICDKRFAGNKIMYALTFSNQKHIPSRVMKNVVEKENINTENSKFWFSDNHIPLYLIKDYEEKIVRQLLLGSITSDPHVRLKFQKEQVKFRRRDVFSYLLHRGDTSTCASCGADVHLRDATLCSICQGKCHKDCTIPLIDRKGVSLSYNIACRICYHAKTAALNPSRKGILNGQLSLQGQDRLMSVRKYVPQMAVINTSEPAEKLLISSTKREGNVKRSSSKREGNVKKVYNGLLWKKKEGPDTGKDFRLENIVLRSKEGIIPLKRPICCLCNAPYRSDLMYIRCEKCLNWFHADALELEEAKIFDLIGFKCGRCRRKAPAKCPYLNPDYKKPKLEPFDNGIMLEGSMSDSSVRVHSSTPISCMVDEHMVLANGDPLLDSFEVVEPLEPLPVQTIEAEAHPFESRPLLQSQQKLSVRRPNIKDATDYSPERSNIAQTLDDYNFTVADNNFANSSEVVTSYDFQESDSCGTFSFNDSDFGYQWNDKMCEEMEDAEYEPQTYFSFTELLASDDGQPDAMSDDHMNDAEVGPSHEPSAYDEIVPEGVHSAVEESGNKENTIPRVACDICKLYEPPPTLVCEICGQIIHSYCSPWVESEEPSSDVNWRCGRCRDWR